MLHLMQPSEIIDFLLIAYYVIHGIKDFGIATTVTKSWSISIPPFYIYIYDNPSKRGQGQENQLEFERTCSFALVF